MPAITMIIWLGTSPAQMQAVQAAQPTVYRQDLIRVEEQRAITAVRTSEPRAKTRAELPSSMR
ncbi:MAG: hypothetical protein IPM35_33625 [Myxococcales bacterium]|nr:hypothetical protein [Myxococcales bacterium]